MVTMIEFTTNELNTLALGWHDALVMSTLDEHPIPIEDLVALDARIHSTIGVHPEDILKSIDVLTKCSSFAERYRVEANLDKDSPAMLDQIYPMEMNSNLVRQRFNDAINLLRTKIK